MTEGKAAGGAQRLDKWLFFTRVVKSRSLAQKLVQSSAVRINREKTANAARLVRPGDVLTISLKAGVRVLKVLDPGTRRGPAPEASTLYEDLSPPEVRSGGAGAASSEAQEGPPKPAAPPDPGRAPDRKERQALRRLKEGG